MKQEFNEAYEKLFGDAYSRLKRALVCRIKALKMCELKEQEMKTTRSLASSEDGVNPDIMSLDGKNLTG